MIKRFVIIKKFGENVIDIFIALNNTLYNNGKSNMSADYTVWHLKKCVIQVGN